MNKMAKKKGIWEFPPLSHPDFWVIGGQYCLVFEHHCFLNANITPNHSERGFFILMHNEKFNFI